MQPEERKIFLIGFMGSGKSHWGKIWAKELHRPFFDLDHIIAEEKKMSVTEIFEKKGEAHFRAREAELLRSFADKQQCIIACGGGSPCFNDNLGWMNENGITVYLQASPQFIYDKVIEEKASRPLIKNVHPAELLFFIEQKLKERQPYYEQAKIILQAELLSADTIKGILNF